MEEIKADVDKLVRTNRLIVVLFAANVITAAIAVLGVVLYIRLTFKRFEFDNRIDTLATQVQELKTMVSAPSVSQARARQDEIESRLVDEERMLHGLQVQSTLNARKIDQLILLEQEEFARTHKKRN